MIEAISRRVQNAGFGNVRTVMGTSTDTRLPPGIDVAVIVDAYREMDEPARPEQILTLFENVRRALKPQGRLGVVDFLPGDGGPGPAAADRINPEAVIKVAQAAGFQLQSRQLIPPFQMMLVFNASPAGPKRLY
jgi:predicted methyltransferase